MSDMIDQSCIVACETTATTIARLVREVTHQDNSTEPSEMNKPPTAAVVARAVQEFAQHDSATGPDKTDRKDQADRQDKTVAVIAYIARELVHIGYLGKPDLTQILELLQYFVRTGVRARMVHVGNSIASADVLSVDDILLFLLLLKEKSQSVIQHDISSAAYRNLVPTIEAPISDTSTTLQANRFNLNESRLQIDMQVNRQPEGSKFRAVVFTLSCQRNNDEDEAILGKHPREVCLDADIENHGSCSGIVRVVSCFRDHTGKYHMSYGTAITISPRYIMSVAHNAWNRYFGPAVSITVLRDGRAGSEDTRFIDVAVIHSNWTAAFAVQNDFAILRVSEPFPDRMKPMEYEKTPDGLGPIDVRVYGFPFDFPTYMAGEQLVHTKCQAEYTSNENIMMSHNGDTFGGTSGGAVVGPSEAVIAVHRGHDQYLNVNTAVAINHHGNDVDKFVWGLETYVGETSADDIEIVQIGGLITFLAWD